MEDINLRKYNDCDYDFIYECKKESYKKYVELIWGEWKEDYQQARFKEAMSKFKNDTYIIEMDNKKIGLYQGMIIDADDYEICNICIIQEYQNNGIGTKILKNIMQKYCNYNIHIQYFKQNPVGELYKKLGFVPNGESETHYKMIKHKEINNIIGLIEKEVKEKCNEYKENAEEHYDFWNEHIKYVYKESQRLALEYNADYEIVSLGALLHDIALITKVGERKDHHINGKILANEILDKYNYLAEKKEKVLGCVYNHRSSKNATNIEELCVADSDILAHFDNIPMLFNSAFNRNNIGLNDVRAWMKKCFEDDYNDLSDRTKEKFKSRYKNICSVVIGDVLN